MVDQQLIIFLYTKILPSIAAFSSMIWIGFIVVAPKSIKTLIRAWISRKAGSIIFLANDDGFTTVDFMNAKMGQGIFQGKDINYIFTPRPVYFDTDFSDAKDPEAEKKLFLEQKKVMDECILHRQIMDIGKPVYFGYRGKSVAVSPKLLQTMKKLQNPKETVEVDLLDARILKIYIRNAFSPSLIDSLTWKHEQIGYFSKPLDKLKGAIIPIGIILVVLAGLYLLTTGQITLPTGGMNIPGSG